MRAVLAAAIFALAAATVIAPAQAKARYGHHRLSRDSGDARPRAWCGWYMRQIKGVANRSYNLARNWTHWGRPVDVPQIGAVVVWPHHVGEIVGYAGNGEWLIRSGNDGHGIRTRARSLAGAIAFRAGPTKYLPKHGDWGAF